MTELKNAFEFKLDFPYNILYREILFVDLTNQISVDFMKKHNLRYCKFLNTLCHPDIPNINIVLCRIHKWEFEIFNAVLLDLQEELHDYPYYERGCEYIKENIETIIKEKKMKHLDTSNMRKEAQNLRSIFRMIVHAL